VIGAATATGTPGALSSGAGLAASVASRAGFTGTDLVIAVAVAGAESSYNPLARNSIGASGLWQILQSAHPDLFSRYNWHVPAQNAAMAYSVWQAAGRSWRPWTTWTGGDYVRFLPAARAAVASLAHATPISSGTAAIAATSSSGGACAAPTAAATPFLASSTGCVVPDPSGTGGCVTPAMAHLMSQIEAIFGHLPVACWSARGGDPYSDHPKGKACDYTMGRIGSYATGADLTRGWQLALWLRANNVALHVNYVIWQGRIWSRAHDTEGWRPYNGGGIYPSSGPTFGHYDHVHVSVA
jgi:hypothetical protein